MGGALRSGVLLRPGPGPGSGLGCKLHLPSVQSINNDTQTQILFGADSEDWDVGGWHSVSTNTGRLTCPAAAVGRRLLVLGQVSFAAGATAARQAMIARFNSSAVQQELLGFPTYPANPTAGRVSNVCVMGFVVCEEGDYLDLRAYQTQGSAINALATDTWISVWTVTP